MKRNKLLITTLAVTLTACGGGSKNQTAPALAISVPNEAASGAWLQIDASGTNDRDGDALVFSWEQLSGPTVTLDLAEPEKPRFAAPAVDSPEDIAFALSVSDGKHEVSATVSIRVQPFDATVTRLLWIVDGNVLDLAAQRLGETQPWTFRDAFGTASEVIYAGGFAATFSLGSDLVLYLRENDGTYSDVVVYDLETNEYHSLLTPLRKDAGLADDEMVVLASIVKEIGRALVFTPAAAYSVSLDGSGPVKIHDAATFQRDTYYGASPDGAWITLSGRTPGSAAPGLFIAPIDGSGPLEQVSAPFSDVDNNGSNEGRFLTSKFSVEWSPDGRRLGFLADYDEDQVHDLHVVDIESGVQQQVSAEHVFDRVMWSWNADSDHLVYVAKPVSDNSADKAYLTSFTNPLPAVVAPSEIAANTVVNTAAFTPGGKHVHVAAHAPAPPALIQDVATGVVTVLTPYPDEYTGYRSYLGTVEFGSVFYWKDADGETPRIYVSEPLAERLHVEVTPESGLEGQLRAITTYFDGRFYFTTGPEDADQLGKLAVLDKNGGIAILASQLPEGATAWNGVYSHVEEDMLHLVAVSRDDDGNTFHSATALVNEKTGEIAVIQHDLGNGRRIEWIAFYRPASE